MAFGLESGIASFCERRESFFKESNIRGSFQERINFLKSNMCAKTNHKPMIVILGAGPAGLLRAIQSVSNGNPTTVIERRPEEAPGRANTVALTATTIKILQYCGIYQYLLEKELIYSQQGEKFVSIRLVDLEKAMKAVLKELSPDSIIEYDSKVTKIDSLSNKIKLFVESSKGIKKTFSDIDILVNAEGSHSTTNTLLNIKRVEVLPSIPVIAAIYKDNRPKISGFVSLLKYSRESVICLAQTINKHAQFLFKFLLSKKFRNEITGALILKTPNQNYVGCGFSDSVNERLLFLKKIAVDKKIALQNVPSED